VFLFINQPISNHLAADCKRSLDGISFHAHHNTVFITAHSHISHKSVHSQLRALYRIVSVAH
jgi:hypothetical protein